jgi:predicted ATPase
LLRAARRSWCWSPAIPTSAKSWVVDELHKVLVPPRGLFASGKFDQYERDIPYSTLVQAFQSLVRPLLGKSDAELAICAARFWRRWTRIRGKE